MDNPNIETQIGDRISVYWSIDDENYVSRVESKSDLGTFNVAYDDDDRETMDMSKKK